MGPGREREDLRPVEAEVAAFETATERAARMAENARTLADRGVMTYERAQKITDQLRISLDEATVKQA